MVLALFTIRGVPRVAGERRLGTSGVQIDVFGRFGGVCSVL